MTIRAVLFDLDDTLVPERSAWSAAFDAACLGACIEHGVDIEDLRREVFKAARARWQASPLIDWCRSVGIGVPSSILSDFDGDGPELACLRGWTPGYRRAVWSSGLTAVGIRDDLLVSALATAFREAFAAGHRPFDDVLPALESLRSYEFAIITNGESGLQREKLTLAGLSQFFPVTIVSSEVGIAKPAALIFRSALDMLGVAPHEAVMVGDNPDRDVFGAHALGMHPVWLDRASAVNLPSVPHLRIESLAELPHALEAL